MDTMHLLSHILVASLMFVSAQSAPPRSCPAGIHYHTTFVGKDCDFLNPNPSCPGVAGAECNENYCGDFDTYYTVTNKQTNERRRVTHDDCCAEPLLTNCASMPQYNCNLSRCPNFPQAVCEMTSCGQCKLGFYVGNTNVTKYCYDPVDTTTQPSSGGVASVNLDDILGLRG